MKYYKQIPNNVEESYVYGLIPEKQLNAELSFEEIKGIFFSLMLKRHHVYCK